jgi:AraC family transcriptional regulator
LASDDRQLQFAYLSGGAPGDDRIGFQTFPEGTYATLTYHGPYGESLMTASETLFEAITSSRRYEPLGLPVIEVYNTTRIDPTSSVNTTDLLVPVRLA